MDNADDNLISWIDWYWQGELLPTWQPSAEGIAVYSRTYAQAVAGIPTRMHFDALTKSFELCFNVNTSINYPTVVYANFKIHYPNGVNIAVEGSVQLVDFEVDVDEANNLIYFQYSGDYKTEISSCLFVSKKAV